MTVTTNSDNVSGLLGSQEKYDRWRQLRLQIEELTDHWLSLATASLTIVQSRSVDLPHLVRISLIFVYLIKFVRRYGDLY